MNGGAQDSTWEAQTSRQGSAVVSMCSPWGPAEEEHLLADPDSPSPKPRGRAQQPGLQPVPQVTQRR